MALRIKLNDIFLSNGNEREEDMYPITDMQSVFNVKKRTDFNDNNLPLSEDNESVYKSLVKTRAYLNSLNNLKDYDVEDNDYENLVTGKKLATQKLVNAAWESLNDELTEIKNGNSISFVPDISNASSYTGSGANYTKIGNLIFVTGIIHYIKASMEQEVMIINLPFEPDYRGYNNCIGFWHLDSEYGFIGSDGNLYRDGQFVCTTDGGVRLCGGSNTTVYCTHNANEATINFSFIYMT